MFLNTFNKLEKLEKKTNLSAQQAEKLFEKERLEMNQNDTEKLDFMIEFHENFQA